jgi:hypothetical protein
MIPSGKRQTSLLNCKTPYFATYELRCTVRTVGRDSPKPVVVGN